jgi:hypothetical protein
MHGLGGQVRTDGKPGGREMEPYLGHQEFLVLVALPTPDADVVTST